jgi:hypothetical protein
MNLQIFCLMFDHFTKISYKLNVYLTKIMFYFDFFLGKINKYVYSINLSKIIKPYFTFIKMYIIID